VSRSDLDDLDVVFLAWRETPEILARHHTAVAPALPADWRGSAVLVENASPAATSAAARAEIARRYPHARRVVVRLARNQGFGRAMNLALAECEGSYAALVNSDGRPGPGMFGRLVEALEDDPDAVWAAPAVHGPDEESDGGAVQVVEELPGTALVMRRQAFLDCGGFDPLFFFYSEDFDASLRIRATGGRLLRVPSAAFHHGKDARSRRGQALREFWYAVGDQLRVHVHAPSRREAARRIARSRRRSLAAKAREGDWPALAGIGAATLAWPATSVLAERRRHRPWDGAALADWLQRHRGRVTRSELGAPSFPSGAG
jgi:GT2 family glycosyltransferase